MNAITKSVIESISTVDSEGNITSVDFTSLKEVITELQSFKKAMAETAKEQVKADKEANKAIAAEAGKTYASTLSEGDTVQYRKADGKVYTATVGKQKEGAKTLHVIIPEEMLEEGKTKRDRYIQYDKLVVPNAEEAVA